MTEIVGGIVIDASVALAWCFPDEASDYAEGVLLALGGRTALVPPIWSVEITNAPKVGERHKRIRHPEVRRFVELLKGPSILEDAQPFADRVINILPLAQDYDLSAFDAAYLEVAVRQGVALATLDVALQKAGRAAGINIFK